MFFSIAGGVFEFGDDFNNKFSRGGAGESQRSDFIVFDLAAGE